MAQSRPLLDHTFSQQLNVHRLSRDDRRLSRDERRPSRDERSPLLSASTFPAPSELRRSVSRSNTDANGHVETGPQIPEIVLNDNFDNYDQEEEEEEHADSDGLYPPNCCYTAAQPRPPGQQDRADPFQTKECQVYLNIHRIRRDIVNSIDDPYSLDQLKAPRMNISVIRPLVDEYYGLQDLSIIYCLLANRMQFIREQSYHTHHQTVNLTRALLCELLAEKILRRYNEHNPGPMGLLKLATILVAGFEPFAYAPEEILEDADRAHAVHWMVRDQVWGGNEGKLTALEIAIVGESKSFLASSACQKVVDAIYRGKVVYTPSSFMDIIPDKWKKRPISLYDPRKGPVLNQYRLTVPRTRNVIELIQFFVLLVLYIVVMEQRETRQTIEYHWIELVFEIYSVGWILDQVASVLEHGWQVYTQNLWSFLDVTFSCLFFAYLVLRLHALRLNDEEESTRLATTALDILSCAAPVLIPRLAFNVMSENLLFVSLRAMMSDFITLTILAVWSFAGFLLALKWLHDGLHQPVTIGKWMIWIWFGLDGTGIDESPGFHWLLGPTLMILFAFLGNTLFLTILVSMLSNTFSMIVRNAVQEIQFRRAVLTFEGVKADAIFAYTPPCNILALLIFLPLKQLLTPRMFHKVNVACVKTINLPVLTFISWYERRTLWVPEKRKHFKPRRIDWTNPWGPRATNRGWWARTMTFWDFSRFSVHGDLQAVFDINPPDDLFDDEDEGENENLGDRRKSNIGKAIIESLNNQFGGSADPRRDSTMNFADTNRKFSINLRDKKSQRRESSIVTMQKAGSKSRSRSIDAKLRKEFADSDAEEGKDEEAKPDHPKGHRRLSKGTRMDSLIDYSENAGAAMQEANARLQQMENSLQRLEAMVQQLVDGGGDSDGSETAENELVNERRTGTLD